MSPSGSEWIVDALRDGDEIRAAETIEDHLRGSYERVVARHALSPDTTSPKPLERREASEAG